MAVRYLPTYPRTYQSVFESMEINERTNGSNVAQETQNYFSIHKNEKYTSAPSKQDTQQGSRLRGELLAKKD